MSEIENVIDNVMKVPSMETTLKQVPDKQIILIMGILSLLSSLIGIGGLFGIIGLVFFRGSRREYKKNSKMYTGYKSLFFGVVSCWIGIGISTFFFALLCSVLAFGIS
jgi:formate hydrogenlyase subunit 3/multisubunit Na+/H+ antiporter MnhD subunit